VCFASVLGVMVELEDYHVVLLYCKGDSIPQELVLRQGRDLSFNILLIWFRNLVFNNRFCS
jgi:hypothetical protein